MFTAFSSQQTDIMYALIIYSVPCDINISVLKQLRRIQGSEETLLLQSFSLRVTWKVQLHTFVERQEDNSLLGSNHRYLNGFSSFQCGVLHLWRA